MILQYIFILLTKLRKIERNHSSYLINLFRISFHKKYFSNHFSSFMIFALKMHKIYFGKVTKLPISTPKYVKVREGCYVFHTFLRITEAGVWDLGWFC